MSPRLRNECSRSRGRHAALGEPVGHRKTTGTPATQQPPGTKKNSDYPAIPRTSPGGARSSAAGSPHFPSSRRGVTISQPSEERLRIRCFPWLGPASRSFFFAGRFPGRPECQPYSGSPERRWYSRLRGAAWRLGRRRSHGNPHEC
jgi:hypothetical protein